MRFCPRPLLLSLVSMLLAQAVSAAQPPSPLARPRTVPSATGQVSANASISASGVSFAWPREALEAAANEGNADAAIAALSREYARTPGNRALAQLLGQFLLLQQDREGARHFLRIAQQGESADADATSLLAIAESGEIAAAVPAHALAWFALGISRAEQGNWAGAQEAFTRAQAQMPGDPFIAANMAITLDRLGRPGDAIAHYRRSLRLAHGEPFFASAAVELRLSVLESLPSSPAGVPQ